MSFNIGDLVRVKKFSSWEPSDAYYFAPTPEEIEVIEKLSDKNLIGRVTNIWDDVITVEFAESPPDLMEPLTDWNFIAEDDDLELVYQL